MLRLFVDDHIEVDNDVDHPENRCADADDKLKRLVEADENRQGA